MIEIAIASALKRSSIGEVKANFLAHDYCEPVIESMWCGDMLLTGKAATVWCVSQLRVS